MSVQLTSKPPKVRILSGEPLKVEAELNQLADDYTIVAQWCFPSGSDHRITFLLIHQSEIRKQQLANAAMPGRRQ